MQTVTKQLLDFDRKHIQKQIDDCIFFVKEEIEKPFNNLEIY